MNVNFERLFQAAGRGLDVAIDKSVVFTKKKAVPGALKVAGKTASLINRLSSEVQSKIASGTDAVQGWSSEAASKLEQQ